MCEVLPDIRVEKQPGNWLKLLINGVDIWTLSGSKVGIRKYLKRHYNIDLRTDKRIKKNYKEFTQRKIMTKNNKKYYVRSPLQ